MDPISMIVAIGIAIVSGTIGYIGGRRHRKTHVPALAVCEGCEHGLSFHDDDGACRAETARTRYDSIGSKTGKVWVPCNCRKYVGPVPAERMLASFTLPPPDTTDRQRRNED